MTNKEMEKNYNHQEVEGRIYKMWEEGGYFVPNEKAKKTFTVLMPPPNANAPLHSGHATYAIQDLVIRFKRMQGYKALYLPGFDHAGFETQVVYERKLAKEGKTRFDFDRETLYKDILAFVKQNSSTAKNQLKMLGLSCNWQRSVFMLEEKVVDLVYETFFKMLKDGLVYRDGYLVNYSTFFGTTFSDLETAYKETVSPLYVVKYPLKGSKEVIEVATVRPETIYADVALAVNPTDVRYKKYVGKTVLNPLNGRELAIICDSYVDKDFGTGALKITPGHDQNDFLLGKKHNLAIFSVINLLGKMQNCEEGVDGLYPSQARVKVVDLLKQKGFLNEEKTDLTYKNRVLVDYKDLKPIEPLIIPNWFINTEDLATETIKAIKMGKIKFNVPLWKKEILRWVEAKKPWPISRQTVFGIRIPIWYKIDEKENPDIAVSYLDTTGNVETKNVYELTSKGISLKEIQRGLQRIYAPKNAKFVASVESPGEDYLQETDTFDTWFSSGQWPFTTLGYPDSLDFKTYFPTNFLDSMWDIAFFWIARMIMFSLYLTKEVPFKYVYFHGAIADKFGKKMSKSVGNVIDPVDFIQKYGSDALRMGILVGGNTEARYTPLDEEKVKGYRNFANKLWNIGRYINMKQEALNGTYKEGEVNKENLAEENLKLVEDLEKLVKETTSLLEKYKFKLAGEGLYQFIWERLASDYLEKTKDNNDETSFYVLRYSFNVCLRLLHPFMPFVTEEIWSKLPGYKETPLIVSPWPSK